MIPQPVADSHFEEAEEYLLNPVNRVPMEYTSDFKNNVSESGGSYIFFHNDLIIYTGETTNIRQRLGVHMRNPENHVLMLKLTRLLWDQIHGEGEAGNRRVFPHDHRAVVMGWISDNLTVSYLSLGIGRKELEERLIINHGPSFNQRSPHLP